MILINYKNGDFVMPKNVIGARTLKGFLYLEYKDGVMVKTELFDVSDSRSVSSIFVDGVMAWNCTKVEWQNKEDLEIQSEEE